jgi:hypothetical protein
LQAALSNAIPKQVKEPVLPTALAKQNLSDKQQLHNSINFTILNIKTTRYYMRTTTAIALLLLFCCRQKSNTVADDDSARNKKI